MLKGTILGIAACLIWGLIFVVPGFIDGFTPFEIALGRHFVNGSISCLLLVAFGGFTLPKYPVSIWKKAFLFSLIVNVGYYTCLVMSVTHSSPALAALIIGISPIVISFYGNWTQKECSFKDLILPSVLIAGGLVLINLPLFFGEDLTEEKPYYLLGLFGACASMLAWSWYVVSNAKFLKTNPEIRSQDWSTLLGVTTLIWVVVLGVIYESWLGSQHWEKFITPSPLLWNYIAGCLLLGILCSWVGTFLWNKASGLLPVSFAGQLTIFETVFGLLFFYLLEQEFPPLSEVIGVLLMFSAIMYGIKTFATQPSHSG
jgi:drug/metabolite transporter (DMT)-like permease